MNSAMTLFDRIAEQTLQFGFIKRSPAIGDGVRPHFRIKVALCFRVQFRKFVNPLLELACQRKDAQVPISGGSRGFFDCIHEPGAGE